MTMLGRVGCMIVGAALLACGHVRAAEQLYVSPVGSDAAAGTAAAPLRTPGEAVVRLSKLSQADRAGSTVWLAGGDYVLSSSLTLPAAASGMPGAPWVLRAMDGQTPRLRLGKSVAAADFVPVDDAAVVARLDESARGKVVQLDLKKLGVKADGPYPTVFEDTGGLLQVFWGGKRLPISRYPADGYVSMAEVLDSGMDPKGPGGTFRYRGDRPERWVKAMEAGGVWVVGYWRVPWVIQAIKVAKIDPANKTITHAAAVVNGIGSKYTPLVNGTRKGDGKEPWYAINLLEEITRPGQWCVDFATGKLYLYPPEALADGAVLLADDAAAVMTIKASDVRVLGLAVDGGLGHGIVVDGAERVEIAGCKISGTGAAGVNVVRSSKVTVRSCDITDVGAEAVRMSGGDRKLLVASGNELMNCHFWNTGVVARASYGVEIDGVGVRVANNLLHDAPLGGIQFRGNDHVIERNEIHNIGLDGGDLGGIYTNGDWGARGNVVRHNLIHHAANANAVYLDDGNSGVTVVGNIAYKLRAGPFIGGGHDHVVRGNVVIDCEFGFHIDDRGLARGYTIDSKGVLTRFLNTVNYRSEPWAGRYPGLVAMMDRPQDLPRPTGNVIERNVLVGCKKPEFVSVAKSTSMEGNTLGPNVIGTGALVSGVEAGRLDFSGLGRTEAARRSAEVGEIPVAEIGLAVDEYRPVLPSAEETGRLEARAPKRVFDTNVDVAESNRKK